MIVQQYRAKQQTENALEHYTILPYAKKKKKLHNRGSEVYESINP